MANEVLYISESDALTDKNGKVTSVWFRFLRKMADKAQILAGGTTTSAIAGTASALPATPAGYLSITLNGTAYKVPYYK